MSVESDYLTPTEAIDLVNRFLFNNEFRRGFEKISTEDLYMLEYVDFELNADIEAENVEKIAERIENTFLKWKEIVVEELRQTDLSQNVLNRIEVIEKLDCNSLYDFTRRERKRLIGEASNITEEEKQRKVRAAFRWAKLIKASELVVNRQNVIY